MAERVEDGNAEAWRTDVFYVHREPEEAPLMDDFKSIPAAVSAKYFPTAESFKVALEEKRKGGVILEGTPMRAYFDWNDDCREQLKPVNREAKLRCFVPAFDEKALDRHVQREFSQREREAVAEPDISGRGQDQGTTPAGEEFTRFSERSGRTVNRENDEEFSRFADRDIARKPGREI